MNTKFVTGQTEAESKLQTVTARGRPVDERIGSVAAARELYTQLKLSNQEAGLRRARICGLINGEAPWDQTRLEELGLGYMTNTNFLEGRAIMDQKASASYELFFEVPTLIQARLAVPTQDPVISAHWGEIVSEEFSKVLFNWSGFLVNMDRARRESDAYGVGIMLWRDEYDWRPKAFSNGSFLPDSSASLDIDELEFFQLRDRISAGQLYRWALRDEKVAAAEGWNVDRVKAVLVSVYVKGEQQSQDDHTQTSTWESVQAKIKSGDPMYAPKEFERVRVVHTCMREVATGEISHYIMTEDQMAGAGQEDDFLFAKPRRFKKMSQALWWLPYNNGDDYIKSVRGLGSMIEPHVDLSNRFLCRIFDAGFITSSLLLQPGSAMDLSRLQLIRMGVFTIVPAGLNLVQSSFVPNIQNLMQLRKMSVDILRNNTGVWKEFPEVYGENQPAKTAREVAEIATKEARLEKANVAYDYEHIQRLYREIFRRMTNKAYVLSSIPYGGQEEARQFVDRCVMRGVPLDLLMTSGAFEIYATRAVGMGSWGVRLDITNQVLMNRGLYDEQGQTNACRDWLAARVGYQNVDRYKGLTNRDKIPTDETSLAMLENNDMVNGQPVVVGSDQTHMRHIQVHVAPLGDMIKMVVETKGQGLDVQRMLLALSTGLPHVEQHVSYLAQDPARQQSVQDLTKFLKSGVAVVKFLQGLQVKQEQQNAKMQQEQQQALQDAQDNQMTAEMQLKMFEAQKKFEIETLKQQSLNAMRAQKTADQAAIKRGAVAGDLGLRAEKQAAELQLMQERAQADMAIDREKAVSKMQARP